MKTEKNESTNNAIYPVFLICQASLNSMLRHAMFNSMLSALGSCLENLSGIYIEHHLKCFQKWMLRFISRAGFPSSSRCARAQAAPRCPCARRDRGSAWEQQTPTQLPAEQGSSSSQPAVPRGSAISTARCAFCCFNSKSFCPPLLFLYGIFMCIFSL